MEDKEDGRVGEQVKPRSLVCYLKVTPFPLKSVYTALSAHARGVH